LSTSPKGALKARSLRSASPRTSWNSVIAPLSPSGDGRNEGQNQNHHHHHHHHHYDNDDECASNNDHRCANNDDNSAVGRWGRKPVGETEQRHISAVPNSNRQRYLIGQPNSFG
jgi:hypothetical protein